MKTTKNILEIAQEYATKCHRETNHRYDGEPYEYHLWMVHSYAMKYIHLIHPHDRLNVLAGAWCHDVIEDCRQTYNDVKNATNETVAELAYALTNEKGKNRDSRANAKYYEEIRKSNYATFLKICDRLANIDHSVQQGSSMAVRYEKESDKFRKELYREDFKEMFDDMEYLFEKYESEKKSKA